MHQLATVSPCGKPCIQNDHSRWRSGERSIRAQKYPMPEAIGKRILERQHEHTRRMTGDLRQDLAVRLVRIDTFSHPDYTVGPGVSPDRALVLPLALAGFTAGQDSIAITRRPHHSPKAMFLSSYETYAASSTQTAARFARTAAKLSILKDHCWTQPRGERR
jgi:hypothetical protein